MNALFCEQGNIDLQDAGSIPKRAIELKFADSLPPRKRQCEFLIICLSYKGFRQLQSPEIKTIIRKIEFVGL